MFRGVVVSVQGSYSPPVIDQSIRVISSDAWSGPSLSTPLGLTVAGGMQLLGDAVAGGMTSLHCYF